jgi:hypothetical protein
LEDVCKALDRMRAAAAAALAAVAAVVVMGMVVITAPAAAMKLTVRVGTLQSRPFCVRTLA